MLVAVMFMTSASAQLVIGLQGGYHQQTFNNPLLPQSFHIDDGIAVPYDSVSTSVYDSKSTTWLAGLQVGYMITPKLYVGVWGGVMQVSGFENYSGDYILIDQRAHSAFIGMTLPVVDHQFETSRMGWTVAPQVKYEIVRYGNMHFNLLLQASYTSLGYTKIIERYTKTFERNEVEDFDQADDATRNRTIDISLRPTLIYEFSEHLSAELSLDFLSIGFVRDERIYDDFTFVDVPSSIVNEYPLGQIIDPHTDLTQTFYAGLNTFMQTLSWESPMLRLGFNWKF